MTNIILKKLTWFIAVTLLFALSACTSKITYEDPGQIETVNTNFGSSDLQQISAKMVQSLLTFPPVIEITQNKRPVLFVDRIKNKTMEHIDTESITDTISTDLLKSGKFRFVDMTKVEAVKEQFAFQLESGFVNPSTAVSMGRQIGAEYMVYGNLSSIVKSSSKKKEAYYKFTLKLMDLQSGLIEWQDEKEIRKQKNKTLFGL